jgi:dinuclear metal center YbgI/SA1388 family protein
MFTEVSKDSAMNGLQIFQTDTVKKIGFAVSANARTIHLAIEQNVDTLLVHHGLFWGKTPLPLSGSLGHRVSLCIQNKINLIAYHLPLDIHPLLGNNVQLGLSMGWKDFTISHEGLLYGTKSFISIDLLEAKLKDVCQGPVEIYRHNDLYSKDALQVYHIGWCTGAGGDFMENAHCDIFISGEYTERHFDLGLESQTTLIKAGHYATERLGILALKNHLEQTYQNQIQTTYLEAWSPW